MTERRLPRSLPLLLVETRAQLRLLIRNPLSWLFTIALPVLLLPLLEALNSSTFVRLPRAVVGMSGGGVDETGRALWMQYATPAVAAFSVAAACFANLAIRTAVARELGVLKRARGTPIPTTALLGGRVLADTLVALAVVAATLSFGVVAYDVSVAANDLPVVAFVVLLGAGAASALGLALTAVIPNADAAPPIVYGVLFPLAFLSNVFYPPDLAPEWMNDAAAWFPLGPLATAMVGAVTPTAAGSGVTVDDIAALVAWGLGGLVVAVATFRWTARRERQVTGSGVRRSLRWLALPVAAAAVVTGVVAFDAEPTRSIVVAGTTEELEQKGVLEVRVGLDRVGGDAFDVGAGLFGHEPGTGFAPGSRTDSYTAVPVLTEVTVLDHGDRDPRAYAFGADCAVRRIRDVSPAWLGLVAPERAGGAFVSTCTGSVFQHDGSCVGGPCGGELLEVPVEVVGAEVRVRGEVLREVASDTGIPVEPVTTAYAGTVTVDGETVAEGGLELAADGTGLAVVGDDGGAALPGGAHGGLFTTVVVTVGPQLQASPNAPVVFLAAPVGSRLVEDEAPGRTVLDHPDERTWRVGFEPSETSDGGQAFELALTVGDGELFAWSTVMIDLRVGPAEDPDHRVVIDLARV